MNLSSQVLRVRPSQAQSLRTQVPARRGQVLDIVCEAGGVFDFGRPVKPDTQALIQLVLQDLHCLDRMC